MLLVERVLEMRPASLVRQAGRLSTPHRRPSRSESRGCTRGDAHAGCAEMDESRTVEARHLLVCERPVRSHTIPLAARASAGSEPASDSEGSSAAGFPPATPRAGPWHEGSRARCVWERVEWGIGGVVERRAELELRSDATVGIEVPSTVEHECSTSGIDPASLLGASLRLVRAQGTAVSDRGVGPDWYPPPPRGRQASHNRLELCKRQDPRGGGVRSSAQPRRSSSNVSGRAHIAER